MLPGLILLRRAQATSVQNCIWRINFILVDLGYVYLAPKIWTHSKICLETTVKYRTVRENNCTTANLFKYNIIQFFLSVSISNTATAQNADQRNKTQQERLQNIKIITTSCEVTQITQISIITPFYGINIVSSTPLLSFI